MINWRDGKAGFVGAAKRLIKGVFRSVTTASSVVAPPTSEGLEFDVSNRLHFKPYSNRLNYSVDNNKLDYEVKQ